ncbi:MAG: HAD-IC family P-type ATPase [Deltaproteobacteria bacterium]|nr:HAD-IC family P-type ATPase [Deltaproteobacteria bacterium]
MNSDGSPANAPPVATTVADNAETPSWHSEDLSRVWSRLESSEQGLSSSQAAERLTRYGPNVLPHIPGDSPLRILWRQINNPLIWVLLGSSAVATALGKLTDGLVVLAVVVLNSMIGFVQEYRASRAIEALREMIPEFASSARDGRVATVAVADLVPGDMVTLASGDKVPADLRLVRAKNLRIEEAALTGESLPAEKSLAPVSADASTGDRTCMAYGGTMVTFGTATAVVVTTGQRTELGRISSLIQGAADLATPLTRQLAWLGKVITIGILAVSAVILGFGVFRAVRAGVELWLALRETLVFAIALAVGAIPEGLPAIVTIALAIGVKRMAARGAIIRRLPAVETLGSTTVICSDKTGTLTRNEMTVKSLWTLADGMVRVGGTGYDPTGEFTARDGQKLLPDRGRALLEAAALCNDATLQKKGEAHTTTGDPTEAALVVAAEKAGIRVQELRDRVKRLDVIPFESENQYMATLHQDGELRRVVLKGAPESIIKRCHGGKEPLDEASVRACIDEMAAQGMRVLAVATKPWAEAAHAELSDAFVAEGMDFNGLIGMIDPPRNEAIEAIRACHQAGIAVKMITGDHRGTARAIGEQLGLTRASEAMEGKGLSELDEAALRSASRDISIFARVAPEHKLLLVKTLQDQGQIVAMTGDGVNDAPALKQSNIGVAMGVTGTSVSKEAADVVLTDDNFATIVAAVEEGRRVYDNLVKSLAFLLPTNLGLAFVLMYGVVFLPFDAVTKTLLLPIRPTQLLWINLVAAVALALPLAFEAKEPNLMQRPPRSPSEPILSSLVVRRTVIAATLMAAGAVCLFHWEYSAYQSKGAGGADSLAEAQTMAVTAIIMFQAFYMLNCRSLRDTVFKIGVFSNLWVFLGIGVTFALQAAFIYAPPLQRIFGSAPLDASELAVATLAGVITLPIINLEKWISRWLWRRKLARESPGIDGERAVAS